MVDPAGDEVDVHGFAKGVAAGRQDRRSRFRWVAPSNPHKEFKHAVTGAQVNQDHAQP